MSANVLPRAKRESVTFFTWNNGLRPDKPNGLIEDCFQRYRCPIEVLGRGVFPWRNVLKLRMLADALQHVTTEYIVGLDSGDVVVVDHPDEIVRRFRQHFTCDLLFNSTGSACWPQLPQYVMFEKGLPGAALSHGRCWLNAGAFVGRTTFCREYFAKLAECAEEMNAEDDQSVVKATWPDWYPNVQIDDRCQIFQWFNESREVLQIERTAADRQLQLIEWLSKLDRPRWGAEVGVLDGYTSDVLLQKFPELNMWLIDRWTPFGGPSGLDFLDAKAFERLRRMALWWTSHAVDRRYELREESTIAATRFADGSLDFVFIDADHSYEAIRDDLTAWWSKIRPGGLLCGHDYGVYGDATGAWGISRAVDEFRLRHQMNLTIGFDGTWSIKR
jgi:predicted O-methyltransferase YrrM